MSVKRIKVKTQVLLLVLLGSILALGFAVFQEYRWGAVDYESMVDSKLTTVITMAKKFVGDDFHDKIDDKDSVSSEDFTEIVDKYNQICVELDLKYIWSVMLIDDVVVFTTSTSPDKIVENKEHAKFFETHTKQQLYKDIIAGGVRKRLYISSKWGEIESLLVPYIDSKGREYVFGAALDNKYYRERVSDRISNKIIYDLFLIIPFILISYVFISWLVKPLAFIATNIQVVANGEYDYSKAKWAQEYLELADSIHYMYTEINENYNTIRSQEKNLKTTLMSIGDGVIVIDKHGVVSRINRVASSLTGWAENEAKGHSLKEVFCVFDTRLNSIMESPYEQVLASSGVVELNRNTTLVSKDKAEYHISGLFAPILDDDNKITGIVITFKNLTEQDRQAERIRQNHEIMLDVLRLSRIAYWEYNVIDSTFWISKEIVSLYGVEEIEEGRIDGGLFARKYLDNAMYNTYEEIKQAVKNKTTFRLIHEVINPKTKKALFFDAAATPILAPGGSVVKLVGLTKDVTEHKSLTNQLYHSQKLDAVGQLAGGVAHDFNNLLGGIIGFAELLLESVKGEEKLEEYCGHIISTGESAANLTQQLLSFARKGRTVSTPINIHTTLDTAITLMTRSMDKKIKIEKKYNANSCNVIGDPSQLESVILNLGINARDAIDGDGEISIFTDEVELSPVFCKTSTFDIEPGRYILIKFIDNGCGMDGETLEHIFEPFFTTKGEGKGTGLGLSVIFGVITSHGGLINAYSELGKGTEFHIYLPLSSREEVSVKQAENEKALLAGSESVLLVDDEEIIRTMAKALLEDMGYNVFIAQNGVEALDIYKNNKENIDVVILDVVMPVMGGMECLEGLIKIDPEVKVLIASGFSRCENSSDFIQTGALDFIDKPYRQMTLAKAIKNAINI